MDKMDFGLPYDIYLLNDNPTSEFILGKGFRQGDPLVPFMFLVVAEGLAGAVREAENKGILEVMKVGRREIRISMLHFVDDNMFVLRACNKNILVLKTILCYFQLASGLKFNYQKSRIVGMGTNRLQLLRYATFLKCNTMTISFTCLGVNIRGNHRKKDFWKGWLPKLGKYYHDGNKNSYPYLVECV